VTKSSSRKVVLHLFGYLPEKYNTRYWGFVRKQIPEFEHKFFAWKNEFYDRNGSVDKSRTRRRVKQLTSFFRATRAVEDADLVVFHGFFYGIWHYLLFLAWPSRFLKKSVWTIWGADLYAYKNRPRGGRSRLTEVLRKKVIPRFGHGTSLVPGDLDIAAQVYGFAGTRFGAFYPNPVDYSLAQNASRKPSAGEDKVRVVMVGNSADPTNQHIAVLHSLHKIWDGSFDVHLPLAYGKPDYADQVAKVAVSLFDKHAQVQRDFLGPNEYSDVLRSVDVAIYNHNRQQGLGNILFLLAAGKTVYIRSDTTTFDFFQANQIEVFSTERLLQGMVTTAELFDHHADNGVFQRVSDLVSDRRAEQEWRNIFQTIGKE
jgi:dTDP-N-acetylfucosamine:lipid II N-acetylfucosaminyltransferase